MNRIAVIVYGQYREFEIAQTSWEFLKNLNCDFYFSTWSKSYSGGNEKNVRVIDIKEENIKKYFPNTKINILEEKNISYDHHLNSKKMIFHWKNGLKMITDSGIKYEQIILNRFDIFYELKTNDITKFYNLKEKNTIYNNRFGLFLNERNTYTIDDQFFIGEYETMSKFINELNYDFEVNVHDYLASAIIELNLKLISLEDMIDMCVVRSNVRELDKINLETINEKFKTW